MAEGKKGFVLYADLIHTVSKMPNEKAGELFKHILSYVNDQNPVNDDLIIQLTFEPIKQQLKRDLLKYESTKTERSVSGQLGNLKRYNRDLYDKVKSQEITLEIALKIIQDRKSSHSDNSDRNNSQDVAKLAVTDTVNVTDTVSVNDNVDTIVSFYDEEQFLIDWNELRTEILQKPSNLNSVGRGYTKGVFKDLLSTYKKDDFIKAMKALFHQDKMPYGNESMRTDPSHLFEKFERYLTVYEDHNKQVYGKKEKQERL